LWGGRVALLAASPRTGTVGRVSKPFSSRKGIAGLLVLGVLVLAACGGASDTPGGTGSVADSGSVAGGGSLTDGDLVKEALRNALDGPVRADVVGFDRSLITVDADGNWSASGENGSEGEAEMRFVDGALFNRVAAYGTGVDGSFVWVRLDGASSYFAPELLQVQILAQMTSGTGALEGDILERTPEEWLSARDTMLDSAEIVSTSTQTGSRTWSVVLKPMYVDSEDVYEESGVEDSFGFDGDDVSEDVYEESGVEDSFGFDGDFLGESEDLDYVDEFGVTPPVAGDDQDTYDPDVSLLVTLDDAGNLVSLRNDADGSEVIYERGVEVAAVKAPKEYLEGEDASLAVARDSAAVVLQSLADALIKAGTANARSDSANPGRGVRIADIDISGSDYAILSGGVITMYGGLDLCIQIYVSGSDSDAKFVKSAVKTASAIVIDPSGRVTSGTCA